MRRSNPRGFTLIELAVVLAIFGIMSAIAFDALRRSRPRANFRNTAIELQGLVHSARQEALATGLSTWVLVFPDYDNGVSKGRIIALVDDSVPANSIGSKGAALNLTNYTPGALKAPPNGRVIGSIDLPAGVLVGPTTGAGVHALKFPYDSITLDTACGFCGSSGYKGGAIVFDGRGRTSFKQVSGGDVVDAPGCTAGASLSIYSTDLQVEATSNVSTLIITSPQGMLRSMQNG